MSFLVPKNLDSGHPGYSVEASYEDFVRTVIAKVQAHPKLWAHTAILVTTDEGGGHFDTGFIQILDFFGDGPRIPMIVVSPYAKRGYVDHSYTDHASIFEVHRVQLGPAQAVPAQPRQSAEPGGGRAGSLQAHQRAGGGGFVDVCLVFEVAVGARVGGCWGDDREICLGRAGSGAAVALAPLAAESAGGGRRWHSGLESAGATGPPDILRSRPFGLR